jgi:carbonic anhydrase
MRREPVVPDQFHPFNDRRRTSANRSKGEIHPWLPETVPVRGFIYDVKSGKLNEVIL